MSHVSEFRVSTERSQMVDITGRVREEVRSSGVEEGICVVFSMHTTAGITVNENADPDVKTDMLDGLARAFPERDDYLHAEGNSHAHLRTSCVGPSITLIVSSGEPVLGTWQGIFLCEFDGPRTRRVLVKVIEGRDDLGQYDLNHLMVRPPLGQHLECREYRSSLVRERIGHLQLAIRSHGPGYHPVLLQLLQLLG